MKRIAYVEGDIDKVGALQDAFNVYGLKLGIDRAGSIPELTAFMNKGKYSLVFIPDEPDAISSIMEIDRDVSPPKNLLIAIG